MNSELVVRTFAKRSLWSTESARSNNIVDLFAISAVYGLKYAFCLLKTRGGRVGAKEKNDAVIYWDQMDENVFKKKIQLRRTSAPRHERACFRSTRTRNEEDGVTITVTAKINNNRSVVCSRARRYSRNMAHTRRPSWAARRRRRNKYKSSSPEENAEKMIWGPVGIFRSFL